MIRNKQRHLIPIPKSYQLGSSTLGSSRGTGLTVMAPCLLVNIAATWRGVGAGSMLSSLNTGPTMVIPRVCNSAEGRWEQSLLGYKRYCFHKEKYAHTKGACLSPTCHTLCHTIKKGKDATWWFKPVGVLLACLREVSGQVCHRLVSKASIT